ncbi:MAG: hypothetical protein GWP08_01240 [Nitrospiraceae bacterium]|nr:hypothetical protein [Nitrospiraceae bacterium]
MDITHDAKPHPMRRQYLVNRPYQGAFAALLGGLGVAVGLISGLAVYRTVEDAILELMYRSHLPPGAIWTSLWPVIIRTNAWLALGSILLAAIAVTFVLWRAARMLRGIEGELRNLETGAVGPSHRGGLHTLTGAQQVAEGLSLRLAPFRRAAEELEAVAKTGDVPQLSSALERAIHQVETGIGSFQC